jgi:hypothetical protein
MKDEEMAKEWVTTNTGFNPNEPFGKIAVRTYLAGLKAGRPQWHKVADGYMPPIEKGNDTINVLTDKGDIAYYSYNFDCWVAEPSSLEIDPPIAWCEIPKFKEE